MLTHPGSARSPVNALLRTRLVSALCTPHGVDAYLALFDRTWSVREVRARIVGIQPETGDATSLFVRPNENWGNFRAGQFVSLSAVIDGVRYTRCFSIASAPEDGLPLRITIKKLPGGRLGTWAAQAARRGDIVFLSQALGRFVVPEPVPPRLLFISAGSGITPIISIVRHLLASRRGADIVCLHYARERPIFGGELSALAHRHPNFHFVTVPTRGAGSSLHGHFTIEHLQAACPRWAERETFVCGPPALEAAVTQLALQSGLGERLHVERFVSAIPIPDLQPDLRCRIGFVHSGREISGNGRVSLLEQAEGAGLRPAYGCRIGICHSCVCKKLSGVVRNQLTGALSTEAGEEIQLCISTPKSDVTLAL